MNLVLKPVVLQRVWDFLGAEYIRSDIHLALQSHAAERQFNNWMFHVLINEQTRHVFETVDFFPALAHPELSGRLQGALDLLVLRCVNKDLQIRCLGLLQMKDVILNEFFCASRPVQCPWKIISEIRNLLSDVRQREERQEFRNDVLGGISEDKEDQQRKRICRLRSLETSLERLIPMNVTIALKTLYYEPTPQKMHKRRMFNGEIFDWMQCVERWGYDYEVNELYQWFVQLKKVE